MKYVFGPVFAGMLSMMPVSVPAIQPSAQLPETAGGGTLNQSGKPRFVRAHSTGQKVVLAAATSSRPDLSAARARIEAMGDAAIRVLQRPGMKPEERRREFHRLLRNHFQLHAIGILTLGRHRASATPRQLQEFDRLFSQFVLIRVSELLDAYSNESFKVNDVINSGRKDVAVRSRIVPERGEATEVYWVMREINGRPRIIDVRVDNISLVITQRDEFNSVIQREGMDGLLHRLRDRVNSN